MGLVADLRNIVGERGSKSQEFAGEGYRLSLNSVEDKWEEIGFILWQDQPGGVPLLAASGQATADGLAVEGESSFEGSDRDLEALIARLVAGDPVAVRGPGHAGEQAIPAGGINDAPGWPTTDSAVTERRG